DECVNLPISIRHLPVCNDSESAFGSWLVRARNRALAPARPQRLRARLRVGAREEQQLPGRSLPHSLIPSPPWPPPNEKPCSRLERTTTTACSASREFCFRPSRKITASSSCL